MKKVIRNIGRKMPRRFKNALLKSRASRFFVWKIYGLATTSRSSNASLDSAEKTLLKRAVDDLLIEVRLLSLRVEVLEEKFSK
jgi:hypothetical protein